MLGELCKNVRPQLELCSEFIPESYMWQIWKRECITKDKSKAMFRASSKPRDS